MEYWQSFLHVLDSSKQFQQEIRNLSYGDRVIPLSLRVINEFTYLIRIILINPCEILSADILHGDISEKAVEKCQDMYKQYFLNELEHMCPRRYHREMIQRDEGMIRQKRALITILIGIIIATVIVPVTLGATGVAIASVNSGRISDIQLEFGIQQSKITQLKKRVKVIEEAVNSLREDFNSLLDRLEAHDKDFQELKFKQVGTNFAISYLVFQLLNAKELIREANRKWKQDFIHPAFLEYFNFTLPCGEDCPITYATPNSCHLSDDLTEFYLDFDVPIINRTLKLVEADPFNLMHRVKNKTCTIKYTGPQNMIVSAESGCAFSMNVKQQATHDLILSPVQGCMTEMEKTKETKHFDIERCMDTHPHDELHYIQIKPYHGSHHIYCPGNTLMVEEKPLECPNDVFLLPMSASFKINNMLYNGSQVYLEHKEQIDPLFAMKANWNLQPTLNLTDLKNHPLLPTSDDKEGDSSMISFQNNKLLIITMTINVAVIVTLVTIIILYYCQRRLVVATRIESHSEPIQLEEL